MDLKVNLEIFEDCRIEWEGGPEDGAQVKKVLFRGVDVTDLISDHYRDELGTEVDEVRNEMDRDAKDEAVILRHEMESRQ